MMFRLSLFLLIVILIYSCKVVPPPQDNTVNTNGGDTVAVPAISEKTAEMEKFSGFFNFYWDNKTGKIWLEIDKWETGFLYVNSLPAGLGSNDIGLDRGQLGDSRIVKFTRSGPKVLLIQPNYSYRAISDNPDEKQSVEEAFAQSVLWGFTIEAEDDWSVLVDATGFFLRDAHNVANRLKESDQGEYTLEASRSIIYLPRTKNFEQNTDVEAMLTFTGSQPGSFVQQVVPSPEAITVRMHHSFVQLPDEDYKPRKFDPRAGYFGIQYMDFATPINEPIMKRFIARHRLWKKDPGAKMSEATEPIIYYVDRGAPEPIRSALIEGASWWGQAFEAAGYKDAFQVKLLPEEVDPLDIRYNVIQWVHRSTRGWSYGSTVTDPRTGEIIKGHVTLGSLRVRQDFLIAEGLLAPYENGNKAPSELEEMALARLRQLSAHEVGHTLGLTHNFAASTNERASVMDYPHPLINLMDDNTFDFSAAYDTGIGDWDKAAIKYGYQDFPENIDEDKALNGILANSIEQGLRFISDSDARPVGGAHPKAHLWDNNENAIDELYRVLKVRDKALNQFSENNIREGRPMATLEEVLVPLYLSHRYQVEAVSKLLGGLNYNYSVRGDGQVITELISPEEQRKALKALLSALKSDVLMLPEYIIALIPPRPFGYGRSRETFQVRTGITFDPLAAAESAANHAISVLLNPERAARLVEYHARDKDQPGLNYVLDELLKATWKSSHGPGFEGEIERMVDKLVLHYLMQLAGNQDAAGQVRALSYLTIDALKQYLKKRLPAERNDSQKAHYLFALNQIKQFEEHPGEIEITAPVELPAGPPIGSD